MGTEFFLLAAFAVVLALLGKRASIRTYSLMAVAAVVASYVIYRSA
ncbi:MAG: hypothetical protein J2P43_08240 [Candidatus Dormibacteraeota bacterium]|nr:hypothetical protein [Candidatus Dormibacteraeota bacterium]MBO0744992.1 hypothetical protein [Candidatus Dormibacteraeota bacterium]